MPFDLHKLLAGLPKDRREAAGELAMRIFDIYDRPGSSSIDYPALARIFERYLEKYNIDVAYRARGPDESWGAHLLHIRSVGESIKAEMDAERIAQEAFELFEQYDFDAGERGAFGYAFLTTDEKKHIHGSLDSIRSAIEKSRLEARKKRALYSRLNKLADEVDKDGTLTDSFFSFGIDMAMTAREMEENARPAIEQVKDVLKIIFRARAKNEGVSLPAPENVVLLPPGDGND